EDTAAAVDAAGVDTAEVDTEPAPDPVPRASCDSPVGGDIELTIETAYEAYPGYDEELAGLDLTSLPDEVNFADAGLIQRMIIAYMLEIPLLEMPDTMARDAIAAQQPMGPAVLGAFAVAVRDGHEGVDLPFLRRGLHRFYQCDRAWPLDLADFEAAVYDYRDLEFYEVCSVPKNLIRRIREDPEAGVYVAQTLDGDVVRETEILMTHTRTDGAIDFIAYDGEGDLIDRGEFVAASGNNVPGAAPYTCIACHFEPGTFLITELFPEMDPVAPSGGCQ
ncbi:MAG: hypothetical protein QF464_19820, partial [Myxococcota bacterium]|nr:hypothetical protein [Myxococcota bacterium]